MWRLNRKLIPNGGKIFNFRCYHTRQGCFGYKPVDRQGKPFQESTDVINNRIKNSNLYRLATAYHDHGHRIAKLDPLELTNNNAANISELAIENYGLNLEDSTKYSVNGIIDFSEQEATIKEIVDYLKEVYCNSVAVEFTYIKDNEEKEWFRRNYEKWHKHEISSEHKCRIMEMLIKSQTFDQFLAKKFPSVKRYGGEGAESMMVFFDEVFNHAMQDGIENVIISMPHRGRLNFMTGLLHYQPAAMFSKMMGRSELPPSAKGTGDVLSHLFKTIDLTMGDSNLHLSLLPNPSHLEACNPVACGKTRARQLSIGDADYSESGLSNKTMCLQVHGDASFAGQGIIPETLMLSEVPHFRTGGSIHLIVNNQIGFTTEPERGRSSLYSSDVGKIIDCPVIHVNGDNPEDLARATKLALLYKQKFAKDIIIDLICFRLWGHNEMDEPAFTQPIMYNAIYSKKSVPDSYAENLEDDKIISNDRVTALKNEYTSTLNSELKNVEKNSKIEMSHLQKQWSGYVQASHENTTWDTGLY
ncbi:putative 2-oxoglutarate dehydrogenase E1 component DHKTD1, mitochondrial [Trichoplax sp. H2]|nr:putative 2-oxoglutarate dehydrogenase E1 component DHKTD1, mitochondrial [Trichoplax sp. H2]|eukprot:RDD42971.1 putative 2-oxoglutarate dehydrogenase E1 component DHKTD1, mitochondrial [Trichoplax sp. H2]